MAKAQLSGSLEEQLATVYALVEQRMAEGRYSGAVHYAKEILRVAPDYGNIQEIYHQARIARREQTLTLLFSLLAAILAIALSRAAGLRQDWQSLLLAFVGLVLGFLLANAWFQHRRPPID
ncbi:MAG: hypothetical protein HUU23_02690 [Caldilineales bacterium]|nr:hypothetical protein [Caldilineales bacterium]